MGTYELAQAPIAPSSERCVRLWDGGSITQPCSDFSLDQATFLIDTQLEEKGVHPLIRVKNREDVAVSISLKREDAGCQALISARRNGAVHSGVIDLSPTAGKRLAFRLDLEAGHAVVDEYQPWGPGDRGFQQATSLVQGGNLDGEWDGVLVGGESALHPGGGYRGRLAEFAIFERVLPDSSIERYRDASRPAANETAPSFAPGAFDDEARVLLLDGYQQLIQWHNQRRLSQAELLSASVLAHLWLFDHYPLMQRASDHFGAMLSLPDLVGDQEIPSNIQVGQRILWSPDHTHNGNWLSRERFVDGIACFLGQAGREVSWKAFIKFVRNKLGGGHFDPDDRKAWQRDLNELSAKVQVAGEPWMAAKMLTLVRSLAVAAEGCGLINLARHFA